MLPSPSGRKPGPPDGPGPLTARQWEMEPRHRAAKALLVRLTAVLVMKMVFEIDDQALVSMLDVLLKSRMTQFVTVAPFLRPMEPAIIEFRTVEPLE